MSLIKQTLLDTFVKFLSHPRVQDELEKTMRLTSHRIEKLANPDSPYFAIEQSRNAVSQRSDIVFITSRFRSGSTLLWNIFRSLDECTAYYEPFNERRWFDESIRGQHTDNTHLGVKDYWREYNGMDDLGALYNDEWIYRALLMDEQSWDPGMNAYLEKLVSRSVGRPVLQFNRIDFRLPWLNHNFPNAKLIHLYRNPRDQFLSFLTDKKVMNKDDIQSSYVDSFYLDSWCNGLKYFFPFLSPEYSPHPFQRFYYLWKLSYIYGKQYADYSMSFEDLVTKPNETLKGMFGTLGWQNIDWARILDIIEAPPLDKWKQYAEDQWFRRFEADCEEVLSRFLTC